MLFFFLVSVSLLSDLLAVTVRAKMIRRRHTEHRNETCGGCVTPSKCCRNKTTPERGEVRSVLCFVFVFLFLGLVLIPVRLFA